MTYEEAVAYINETPKFTTKNSLEHTKECLRRLGNPQDSFRVIHVAGTNGKGSTCAFLASVLREAGYSCGLFTSPHLVEINERFQINEENVSDDDFLQAFCEVKALSDRLVSEGSYHPTYFEMLFLMGMIIFAKKDVEYVILETGLGGRLDATTAVEHPIACVITSISRDHTQYLGNTIAEIAGEKAGIIVPGVPVIYDGNDPEASGVIQRKALEAGSPFYEVLESDGEVCGFSEQGIWFRYPEYGEEVFHIPFVAKYQVMNASLAIRTMMTLRTVLQVPGDAIARGLEQTKWPGRMEMILPGVIVDGAHNEDGVKRFMETAEYLQRQAPLSLLFSAVEDKDYENMIGAICKRIRFEHVVVTQVGGYREVPAEKLAAVFRKFGYAQAEAQPDIPMAFRMALHARGEKGLLFCVGSLYLAGEIKRLIRGEYND